MILALGGLSPVSALVTKDMDTYVRKVPLGVCARYIIPPSFLKVLHELHSVAPFNFPA
jgi:hypothetical protein